MEDILQQRVEILQPQTVPWLSSVNWSFGFFTLYSICHCSYNLQVIEDRDQRGPVPWPSSACDTEKFRKVINVNFKELRPLISSIAVTGYHIDE